MTTDPTITKIHRDPTFWILLLISIPGIGAAYSAAWDGLVTGAFDPERFYTAAFGLPIVIYLGVFRQIPRAKAIEAIGKIAVEQEASGKRVAAKLATDVRAAIRSAADEVGPVMVPMSSVTPESFQDTNIGKPMLDGKMSTAPDADGLVTITDALGREFKVTPDWGIAFMQMSPAERGDALKMLESVRSRVEENLSAAPTALKVVPPLDPPGTHPDDLVRPTPEFAQDEAGMEVGEPASNPPAESDAMGWLVGELPHDTLLDGEECEDYTHAHPDADPED